MHSSATGSYQLAADAKGEPIIAICVAHPNQQPSEGSGLDSTSPENFSDEVGLSLKQQPSKSGFDSTSAENFSDEVGVSNNPQHLAIARHNRGGYGCANLVNQIPS